MFLSIARLVHATKCICADVVGNYLYVAVTEERSDIMYRYHMVRNVWERLPRYQYDYFYVGCMSSVNEYIYMYLVTMVCFRDIVWLKMIGNMGPICLF